MPQFSDCSTGIAPSSPTPVNSDLWPFAHPRRSPDLPDRCASPQDDPEPDRGTSRPETPCNARTPSPASNFAAGTRRRPAASRLRPPRPLCEHQLSIPFLFALVSVGCSPGNPRVVYSGETTPPCAAAGLNRALSPCLSPPVDYACISHAPRPNRGPNRVRQPPFPLLQPRAAANRVAGDVTPPPPLRHASGHHDPSVSISLVSPSFLR